MTAMLCSVCSAHTLVNYYSILSVFHGAVAGSSTIYDRLQYYHNIQYVTVRCVLDSSSVLGTFLMTHLSLNSLRYLLRDVRGMSHQRTIIYYR